MKLSSASLDDVHQELRLVMEQNGGRRARLLLRLFSLFYRAHHSLVLFVLRHAPLDAGALFPDTEVTPS